MKTIPYSRLQNQACVVNYAAATPVCLQIFYPNALAVQPASAFLQQEHLGIFAGDTAGLI
jgi:hypothetical protein